MREEQMMNQSLSIVVKLYQGFLQGLPDLFESIDVSKVNSYYQDVLRRDIKQTDECLCIAAEDEAVRLVEIKLQEKGIPWEKRKASDVQDLVKANGMFVFLCRSIDEQRVQEAIKEIQKEFALSQMPEQENNELESEQEQELEREKDFFEQPVQEQESAEEDSAQVSEAESETEEPEQEEFKKEKQKTKKTSKQEQRRERDSKQESYADTYTSRNRTEEYRYTDNKRETYSDKEKYEPDSHATSGFFSENKKTSPETDRSSTRESLEREGLAGYNRYRETDFSHRPTREEVPPYKERQNEANPSATKSQERTTREFPSEKKADEPYRTAEKSDVLERDDKRTVSLRTDDERSSTNDVHDSVRAQASPIESDTRQTQTRENRDHTQYTHESQASEKTDTSHTERSQIRHSSESHHESTRMGGFQSLGNERTILSTEKQAHTPETEIRSTQDYKNKSVQPRTVSAESKMSVGVQILGNGNDLKTSAESTQSTSRGGFFAETVRRNTAEIVRESMQTAESSKDSKTAYTAKEHYHPDDVIKTIKGEHLSGGIKTNASNISVTTISYNAFSSRLHEKQQDAVNQNDDSEQSRNDITLHQNDHSGFYDSYSKERILKQSISEKDILRDQILASRRFYQVRGILSPDHFKSVFHASRRIVMQSVLSRETEGGKVAMDIIDYGAPIAIVLNRKLLANGALQIARSTHCNMDVMAALYAARFEVGMQEAQAALSRIRNVDMAMVLMGKNGLSMADSATFKAMGDVFELSNGNSLISMISRMDNNTLMSWIQNMEVSDEFKKALLGIPAKDLTPAKLQALIKQFSGKNEQAFLKTLLAAKINSKYGLPNNFGFHTVLRGWLTRFLKSSMKDSDAARALGQILGVSKNTYMAYRSGMRLLLTILNKIPFKNKEQLVSEVAFKMMSDPLKVARTKAAQSAKKVGAKAGSKLLGNRAQSLMTKRSVQHASSALKFLAHPMKSITVKLYAKFGETALWKAMASISGKIAALAAKAGAALGWIAVAIIVIILATSLISSIVEKQKAAEEGGMPNYNFAQDTEIVQEIITELTQKNEAFMAEINDAANHRGTYNTTAGLITNENVSFYESYNIVFRDAYGNELEPTHVDLNNTKAILSMASKFMPYPFQKPSENASQAEKKAYEDIKQHFKDYCYFLWAATHQIAIEEYHPGHSEGIDGAIDNSGLETTLDKGLCDKNGIKKWFRKDFTQDIVQYGGETWICDSCDEVPSTGNGDEMDDLCTHGKDDNAHGGWKMTGNKRYVYNCHSDHRHVDCDDEGCVMGTCEEEGNSSPSEHGHFEYEWIYECGGHMGLVVYVTIGDLSRDPGFDAAEDVDYSAVGQYGDSISGDDVLNESGTLTYRGYAYTKSVDQSVTPFVYVYTLTEDGSTYEGSTDEEAMNKFQQHVDSLPPKDTSNAEMNTNTPTGS